MSEQRTFNTAIQGQALIAATNGLDIRALQFTNTLQQLPPMTGTNSPLESRLYASDLIQASVGHFLVHATGYFYLGPDTADQASNYHSLFDLQDENAVRVLNFVKVSGTTGYLSNNAESTANHVTVNISGDSPAGNAVLFGTNNGVTSGIGTERLVLVRRTSPTGVNFTILPGCCGDILSQSTQ